MLDTLVQRRDLSEAEAAALLRSLTTSELAPAMAGALLAALRAKGVTADDILAGQMLEFIGHRGRPTA